MVGYLSAGFNLRNTSPAATAATSWEATNIQIMDPENIPIATPLMATAGLKAPPEIPPTGHGAGCHGEADRQSIERVVGVILARGDIQHDVAERERDEQFCDESRGQGMPGHVHRTRLRRGDSGDERRRQQAADNLCDPVSDGLADLDPAADQHRQRHRRVVVSAGDVPADVDHRHQDRPDGQGSKWIAAPNGGADREDQEQGADHLDGVLHCGRMSDGLGVPCACDRFG